MNKSPTKISTNDLDQISKVETYFDIISECLDQIEKQQNCISYSLNLKETETQINSLLENDKESEVDWDNSDNLLVKIGDFSIKIDTLPNLLNVETENDSSEESDKILVEENSSNEIIETAHDPDTDTEVNLNSISLLESSESSPSIS